MYKDIIDNIDESIEIHKNVDSRKISDEGKYYFIQGLEMAKQIIDAFKDINTEEVAYEKFEDITKFYLTNNYLEPSDIEEIVQVAIHEYEDGLYTD